MVELTPDAFDVSVKHLFHFTLENLRTIDLFNIHRKYVQMKVLTPRLVQNVDFCLNESSFDSQGL